jgi:uncharacterized protein YjaZ
MAIAVIPAYRVVKRFVKDIEGVPADAALDSLWANLRTYVNHMLSLTDAPFADLGQRMAVSQLGDPDLGGLADALGSLESGRAKELAEEALHRCAMALPRPDLSARVVLLPGDGQSRVLTSQMHGVLGISLGSQTTLLFLWPTSEWQPWLGYTVAHEYAHLVRNLLLPRRMSGNKLVYQKSQEPETLLDAMVAEGIADAFAMELCPGMEPASVVALSAETETQVWPKVRRRLAATDTSEIRRFLFGDNDRVPVWTGYTIGYRVVKGYLAAHPAARPASLIGLAARAIFEASQHQPAPVPAG